MVSFYNVKKLRKVTYASTYIQPAKKVRSPDT